MEPIAQPASPQKPPRSTGRVLARTLAEVLGEPTSKYPIMTQTIGLGGFRDTDLG